MAPFCRKEKRIWNEDLVKAFRARRMKALREGKSDLVWKEGADFIEAKRGDIWIASTGRIMNKPVMKKASQQQLVDDILAGKASILPDGHIPTSIDEASQMGTGSVNPFENSSLLKKIKLRGGSYAILMAFHHSVIKTLTEEQICDLAQPFCDEEMRPNFHAGKPYGGWSSRKTLANHGLVINVTGRTRLGAVANFSLTSDGEKFIEVLLKKFPLQGNGVSDRENIQGVSDRVKAEAQQANSRPSAFMAYQHRQRPNKQLKDAKGRVNRPEGIRAQKTNMGSPTKRRLMSPHMSRPPMKVRIEAEPKARRNLFKKRESEITIDSTTDDESEAEFSASHCARSKTLGIQQGGNAHVSPTFTLLDSDSDDGDLFPPSGLGFAGKCRRTLSDHIGSTPKESNLGPKRASRHMPKSPSILNTSSIDDGEEEDRVLNKRQNGLNQRSSIKDDGMVYAKKSNYEVIEICDSDDDEEVDNRNSLTPDRQPQTENDLCTSTDDDDLKKYNKAKSNTISVSQKRSIVVRNPYIQRDTPLVDTNPNHQSKHFSKLTIYIDNRERNRNRTPRYLRTELTRLLESSSFASLLSLKDGKPEVEETPLIYGDFSFVVGSGSAVKRLDVVVERKRIGDLVQRSAKGDHWKQLTKLRSKFRFPVLLIEVDMKKARNFIAYGALENNESNPFNTTIEDENSVLRLMGRALLAHKGMRFVQTREEQGSLRAVAALGFIGNELNLENQSNPEECEQRDQEKHLVQRLVLGGVPWSLAYGVAKDADSIGYLRALDSNLRSDRSDARIILPVVEFILKEENIRGSSWGWSEAIFRAIRCGSQAVSSMCKCNYTKWEDKVQDPGLFLANLHQGISLEMALAAADQSNSTSRFQIEKQVVVTLPTNLKTCFPPETQGSFYKIDVVETDSNGRFDVVTMQVAMGRFLSGILYINLCSGTMFVETIIRRMDTLQNEFSLVARLSAEDIAAKLIPDSNLDERDRRVLILEGLPPALDAMARKAGCRVELKPIVDLALAFLMLEHDVVVIQAFRKSGEKDEILKNFALASLWFQPLVEAGHSNKQRIV